MQLSKTENEVIEIIKENKLDIFRIKDSMLLTKLDKTKAYNILKALKKKEAIKTIKSGTYAFFNTPELIIASNLNWPSYLSFFTALSYYKLTDQLPKTMFIASAQYTRQIGNYKFIQVSKKRFFGYTSYNGIVIAEKEKAILDSLLFPKYAGGIQEIEKAIKKALSELDIKKIIKYALQMGNKAVIRRLGYLLEKNKVKNSEIDKLYKKIGKGYEKLDPSLQKNNVYNAKWLLNINI
jgi:predicted transcriptional regulator of viral defense system